MGPIRTLSLADYRGGMMSRSRFLTDLDDSWHASGFVVIEDQYIRQNVVQATFGAGGNFFDLPTEVKNRYARPDGGHQRGYTPKGLENAAHLGGDATRTANIIEFWHEGRDLPQGHPYLPIYSPNVVVAEGNFSPAVSAMGREWEGFEERTAPVISDLLDMPTDWFAQFAKEGDSITRVIQSPAMSEAYEGQVLNFGHTDVDAAAGVIVEKGGLEVWIMDQWVPIEAQPGAVVWNIGDMMQIMSAGYYPSAWHRVVARNATTKRLSIARFTHPPRSAVLRPMGRFANTGDELWRKRICTAGWFLFHRLREINLFHGPNPYAHEGTNPALFPPPHRPGLWAA